MVLSDEKNKEIKIHYCHPVIVSYVFQSSISSACSIIQSYVSVRQLVDHVSPLSLLVGTCFYASLPVAVIDDIISLKRF